MIVQIEGRNLPGRRCRPDPEGQGYENVHVGPGSRGRAIELVPGDAREASWTIEVQPVRTADGALDFKGLLVDGKRGDRFLYLNWGTVAPGGAFFGFRRAKISLSRIPPELVESVLTSGERLIARVDLTAPDGNPICARVPATHISWGSLPD